MGSDADFTLYTGGSKYVNGAKSSQGVELVNSWVLAARSLPPLFAIKKIILDYFEKIQKDKTGLESSNGEKIPAN